MTHLWCILVPFGAYYTVSGILCFWCFQCPKTNRTLKTPKTQNSRNGVISSKRHKNTPEVSHFYSLY